MALLVLRLLAVYFGTAAAFLFVAHRYVRPLDARVAVALALAPFLLTGRALVTAGVYAPLDIAYAGEPLGAHRAQAGITDTRTPLLSDVVASYIPAKKAVREAVKNGHLPLWNRFSMCGEPLLAFQQAAAFHPGTWIGFLLPLAQAWTFDMALRLFIALLSAYLFFRDLECGEPESLFGAAGWAFCDQLVFFLGYSVTPAVAPFPLLLLGLRRLARAGDRRAVAIVLVSLVLITVAGHPETLLHAVFGAGIYFLFELGFAEWRSRRRAVLLAFVAGALALGLTAVVLLPFAEILPRTYTYVVRSQLYAAARKSAGLAESLHRSVRNALPYAYGVSGHGLLAPGFGVPAAYAGSLVFPLALLGLFSRRRERWPFALLTVLGLAFWARLVGITDAVSRLPLLRIAVNDYLVFLASFGSVALAVLGLERTRREGSRKAFALAAALFALLLALSFVRVRPHLLTLQMPEGYLRWRLALQLVPLAIAASIAFSAARRRLSGALLPAILALFTIQRGLEAGEVYPTFASGKFYPEIDLLKVISHGVPERVAAIGYTLIPNSSALYELEDVRGYEALTLLPLVETYPLWCVEQPVSYNRVDDLTRPFLSFLNVRYVITGPYYPAPPGWRVLAAGWDGKVLENPNVVPRVFAPDFVMPVRGPARQTEMLSRIEDFRKRGVMEAIDAAEGGESWVRNGPAVVRVLSYGDQAMKIAIESEAVSVIGSSIPRWPGWKLRLDGRDAPTIAYNRAFLGFRVPPGRHEARLRYWPDGVAEGMRVSGLTLALCVGLTVIPRLRRGLRRA